MWRHRFPHYRSMGAFCCHGNQFWCKLPQNLMQPFPHPIDASHNIWPRLANWLQRYSSLKVWKTADRPLVYYKLTLWAFGSGELTIILQKLMLWTILQSFSFIPHIHVPSEELIFNIFHKFSLLVATTTNQIDRFGQKVYIWYWEDHSSNISKKLSSKYLQWNSNKCQLSFFPFISLWKFKVAIATKIVKQQQWKTIFLYRLIL